MPKRRAEFAQLLFVELLLLVRDVAAFAGFAQAVALDRLGQNHRRLALVLDAPPCRRRRPFPDRGRRGAVFCSFSSDKCFTSSASFGILAEEVLADVARRA